MGKFQALGAVRDDPSEPRPSSRPKPPPDLADLIARTALGHRAAFRALYDETAPKLLGIVLRILRDRAAAEDVVQEVFLKVWQSAGSYDPGAGSPLTWLATIARHRAIDVVRRRRDAVRPSLEDPAEELDRLADPRRLDLDVADADRLAVCLGRLDPDHGRCFVEAYLGGYSREELAARYARPVNTIKTWLHRAAASLRSCLGEG